MYHEILDKALDTKHRATFVLSVVLAVLGVFIWLKLEQAGHLPYDRNYGEITAGFMASCLGCLIILVYGLRYKKAFFKNLLMVVVFLFFCSPLSIYWVCVNYRFIFGVGLAHSN